MKKIMIIGAGPAGLTAAYELTHGENAGKYDVTVLEASDAIGGISKTVRHNGNRMDIGGHRFFSKDEQIMDWWKNMMPLQGSPSFDDRKLGREKPMEQGGPDPDNIDRVMLVRQRVSRIYYLEKFFDYPISMKLQTFKNMGLIRTLKAGFSYLWSAIFKKEETSLENFYINRFGKVLYSMFFEGYTEKLWGRHPSEISASWGAQRVKGLSIRALIKDMFKKAFGKKDQNKEVETSLIEQYWYPKLGPGQLWECVAEDIKKAGGKVLMNTEVNKIEHDGKNITAVYADGIKYDADEFISSMPLSELVTSMSDNVPENVLQVAKGLPFRDFVTVGLLVNKLNLKNETDIKTLGNIVPDCWIYVQETNVKLGRIQIFNNWSPYMVADPENTVWIGLEYFCTEGDDFWNMSDDECIKFAAAELESMGVIRASDVLDSHREKIKKAYPAYFDTYDRIDEIIDWINGFGNLYCVGRNGQHRYNNMDHSMATSLRAVDCITGKSSDKNSIWAVNTEQSYHEKK